MASFQEVLSNSGRTSKLQFNELIMDLYLFSTIGHLVNPSGRILNCSSIEGILLLPLKINCRPSTTRISREDTAFVKYLLAFLPVASLSLIFRSISSLVLAATWSNISWRLTAKKVSSNLLFVFRGCKLAFGDALWLISRIPVNFGCDLTTEYPSKMKVLANSVFWFFASSMLKALLPFLFSVQ